MFNKSKKKQAAAEAAEAQRAEVAALQSQLDAVRSERSALQDRLDELSEMNLQLDRRLEALDQGVQSMGEQLLTVSSSTSETSRRVTAIDERVADVEALGPQLDAINERLQSFDPTPAVAPPVVVATPPPTPPPPPPPAGAADADDIADRVTELRDQLERLTQQTTSIDARVTSVSLELANQLTELSSDIDELNRRRATQPDDRDTASGDTAELEARISERLNAALDEVVGSTERLAAEQARYEIQFRADLAELAERLRRPGPS